MNIVILDRKTLGDDVSVEKLKEFGDLTIYSVTKRGDLLGRIAKADIIVTNKVVIDKYAMDNAKNLKLICVAATGMNNVDLKYAQKKGIVVKNVEGYSTDSVVQHTFAMLFYLLEKLRYYDMIVKGGIWTKNEIFTCLDRPFFEIKGKTWGIIGLGTIGKEVARVAKSFGCNVIYYSTSGENRDEEFERVSLDELLKRSEIVSIHAPLNEKTKNLIGKKELDLMKEGAILLNLGRGGIVNERHLANKINEGDLYVGLDVLEKEPIEEDHPLMFVRNSDNLLITPHIAWTSVEARKRLIEGIYENIKNFVKEKR